MVSAHAPPFRHGCEKQASESYTPGVAAGLVGAVVGAVGLLVVGCVSAIRARRCFRAADTVMCTKIHATREWQKVLLRHALWHVSPNEVLGQVHENIGSLASPTVDVAHVPPLRHGEGVHKSEIGVSQVAAM